jgi:hypothetical protein
MLNVQPTTAAEKRFDADCSSVCQPIAKLLLCVGIVKMQLPLRSQ